MESIPFLWRLLALLLVLAVAAAWELRRPRAQRHRWREYLVLLACGVATAILGASVDLVTSRLSPEYFTLGKGLQPRPGFTREVLCLGGRAGFSAGIAGGAILLFANPRPAAAFQLLRRLPLPFALAVAGGIGVGCWVAFASDHTHPAIDGLLAPEAAARFTTVWGVHLGVYAGGALGLLSAVRGTRSGPVPAFQTSQDT